MLIKIGNKTINLNPYLEINGVEKYILTAPNGNYLVEILANGENKATKNVTLTGNVIKVKEASKTILLMKYPMAWIFIIFILGFIIFLIFKKGYKKNFLGYISRRKYKEKINSSGNSLKKKSIVESKNKAELSLSLRGDKQKTSIICLKIKNFAEIKKEQSIIEMLQKATDFAEQNKAATYENQEYLFFIFAPIITRTFKNEKKAVEVAQEIKKILTERNKILRNKLEFGISLNNGDIIGKKESEILKFMSFGNLITSAKKISSISNEEIYLTKEIKERLMSDVKTERKEIQGIEVYIIKEIKHKSEEHKKFISNFIKKLEKEKK